MSKITFEKQQAAGTLPRLPALGRWGIERCPIFKHSTEPNNYNKRNVGQLFLQNRIKSLPKLMEKLSVCSPPLQAMRIKGKCGNRKDGNKTHRESSDASDVKKQTQQNCDNKNGLHSIHR